MKFKFKDKERAKQLVGVIEDYVPDRGIKIVHVCGTHEVTITNNGIRSLLPEGVYIREGPGCPVCVTPTRDLDAAIKLARKGAIIAAFGDMMNVPGTEYSLNDLGPEGAEVKMVYSVSGAVELARKVYSEVVFLGVGFETTAPMTAAVLSEDPPDNFSIIPSNKLIPPAMASLMELPDNNVDGFIAPGHVSTIIGCRPYEPIAEKYGVPIVVGGFEPLDILYSIALIVKGVATENPSVENGYPRAVNYDGNSRSRELIEEVFRVEPGLWRGIGRIRDSGLGLRDEYKQYDALARFDVHPEEGEEVLPNCLCPQVLTARATPDQCGMFGKECTPGHPYGPCMVGDEAMCNIWFKYGGRPQL
ncbi:MAG: hydrogenase formation protein HypD [Candidatus Bipolaricaulota bacterium]